MQVQVQVLCLMRYFGGIAGINTVPGSQMFLPLNKIICFISTMMGKNH